VVVVDSRGRRIKEGRTSPADAGSDLKLTLDLDLQQEAALQLEGKVGTIVALDPRQGDILAMVSSPSFDPNRFAHGLRSEDWWELVENPHHPMQNRAVQNVYPPGSVFKIVMALAGLDLGLVDADTTRVWCKGHSKIYNNTYRCWKAGGHGVVDLRRSLEGSCNVFYHQLGQKMEIDKIAEYARRFGLGQRTGVDLEGEKSGLVPSRSWSEKVRGSPWYPGETISVSTGQGPILVTPLQVAVMMAAVANGGFVVTPRFVRGEEGEPPRSLEIAREHLDVVREGLWSVVQGAQGTATRARVEGLELAGKTGTAQVISQKQRTRNEDLPEQYRDHAWFASFAPFEDPRLVVVVFVEHGGAGSSSAAPLAKALYEKFLKIDPASDRIAG
jgi:penicillin-binding protein 2